MMKTADYAAPGLEGQMGFEDPLKLSGGNAVCYRRPHESWLAVAEKTK